MTDSTYKMDMYGKHQQHLFLGAVPRRNKMSLDIPVLSVEDDNSGTHSTIGHKMMDTKFLWVKYKSFHVL